MKNPLAAIREVHAARLRRTVTSKDSLSRFLPSSISNAVVIAEGGNHVARTIRKAGS